MAYNLPPYFQKAPVAGQFPGAEQRWKVYNRTGGALTPFGIYMFDTGFSATETTTLNWMDAASCWRNIVPVASFGSGTAATVQLPYVYSGFFCVAQEAAADNAETEIVVVGTTDILVRPTAATSYYPRLSPVIVTASQVYGTVAHGNASLTTRLVARTLVPVDDEATGSNSQVSCHFSGFGQYA